MRLFYNAIGHDQFPDGREGPALRPLNRDAERFGNRLEIRGWNRHNSLHPIDIFRRRS
jgi:hypothetical protein